jgi:hypothetical protein
MAGTNRSTQITKPIAPMTNTKVLVQREAGEEPETDEAVAWLRVQRYLGAGTEAVRG